jgi:putative inorganic carbon (hco3(-)) transporter
MGAVTELSQDVTGQFAGTSGTDCVGQQRTASRRKPLVGAFAALLLFMLIYCARPEDWIPGLAHFPLAKIAGILALLALVFSLRHVRDRVPRETFFLFFLIVQLFVSSSMSPVWRGGAMQQTLVFAKVLMVFFAITATVSTLRRLRWILFTQAISALAIAVVAIWKGRQILGRLDGILGGNYSDPNDMALAILIAIPLCLGLLFLSKNWFWKFLWSVSILLMTYAVFQSGSRSGFLALVVAAVVFLWDFAVRGRRRYLLVVAVLAGAILWQLSGGMLAERLKGTFNSQVDTAAAYSSSQERQQLFWRSLEVTAEHPLFGVGQGNFNQVSGNWHTTHNSFTLMSSEGGLPAFILYSLILWCGFRNIRRAKQLGRGQKASKVMAGALNASLAGYLVGSCFLSVSFQYFPYILVAYTSALFSIAGKSAAQPIQREFVGQAPRKTELAWEYNSPISPSPS